ncbi:MAG: winged helix-turn-helix domain-containing protein [Pyrinomonadaceae bacterium]
MAKQDSAKVKKDAVQSTEGERGMITAAEAAEAVSNELDRVIHERMRLGIISALAANNKLSFAELKSLLNTTDGNISVHARKLEDAGFIVCEKSFQGRKPLTEYNITAAGKAALAKYLNHMEALINAVKAG